MALSTPILQSIAAFDASNKQAFTFTVIGGDQTGSVKLTIVNQETGAVAYTRTITTFGNIVEYDSTQGTGGALVNGNYYYAFVNTYSTDGTVMSANSNFVQFYCYTTPTFVFTNIPTSGVIANSSYNFTVSYTQSEGEVLNSYIYNLYDTQGLLIATSGLLYAQGASSLNYTFAGFSDKSSYSIEVKGQTAGNTEITTGVSTFTVNYIKPSSFSVLELSNNCQGGYINIQSNLINIIGKSNPTPPVYVKDNTAVDARTDGRYVEWDSAFQLEGDFTAQLWGYNFVENSTIITLSNSVGDSVTIGYRVDADNSAKVYCDCVVISDGLTYYVYSSSSNASSDARALITLRRTNGLYQVDLSWAE